MTVGVAQRSAGAFAPSWVDVVCDPDSAVAELAVFPADGASVQAVALVDEARLSEAGRIDYLVALRRAEGALAAARFRTLASLGSGAFDEHDYVGMEVAPALQVSQTIGMTKLHHARYLCSTLPESLDALARGDLTELHVRILIEGVWTRPPTVARAVQTRVLARAGGLPPGRFRAAVRQAVLEVDAAQEQRRAAAKADRAIRFRPVEDGMTAVSGLLTAEDAAALDRAIDAVAAELKHPDDGLTNDQRRADALGQIAGGVLADPALLRRQRQAPAVNVTVSWSTLLRLIDDPGWLAAFGPIGAEHAREVARAARRWRILLTDDAGRLLGRSVSTYEPSPALRALILLRDRRCTFPGCTALAERADLDHVQDWARGGATDAANLEPLCREHHELKTSGLWTVVRSDADGTTTWTSPTGHVYVTAPEAQPRSSLPPPGTQAPPDGLPPPTPSPSPSGSDPPGWSPADPAANQRPSKVDMTTSASSGGSVDAVDEPPPF